MNLATPRDASWRSAPVLRVGDDDRRAGTEIRHASLTAVRGIVAAAATSASPMHRVNEDCHSPLEPGLRLFVVADGVGGGALASTVSRALVSDLHRSLGDRTPDADTLRDALLDADRDIARSVARHHAGCGAATVVLCAPRDAALSQWLVAWVGDCRAYRIDPSDDADAEALTSDDTYRHLGEAPPPGSGPDDPARMVGNGAVDVPNVRGVDVTPGALLVLCSDGVHKHTLDADIARVMREAGPLERRCARLVDLARQRGSRDDATVLAVQRAPSRRWRVARVALAAALVVVLLGALAWLVAPAALLDTFTLRVTS